MTFGKDRFEELMETIRAGSARDLHDACAEVSRLWKDAPVDGLLSLKEQFRRLDLEERESILDVALIEIADRRQEPFTVIATQPDHPLWRPAVEVLSMAGVPDCLDLFIRLLPLCPKKNIKDLLRAIGCYNDRKAVEAVAPFLCAEDEGVFFEAVLTLKRSDGPKAMEYLKGCLAARRRDGSEMATVLEAVIEEMGQAPVQEA